MTNKANAIGIAGGSIAIGLIDVLVSNGTLTKDQGSSILSAAISRLNAYASVERIDDTHEAISFIRRMVA